jgi:hypothetical protein
VRTGNGRTYEGQFPAAAACRGRPGRSLPQ